MMRMNLSVPMPVLHRHKQLTLDLGTAKLVCMTTGLSYNGTLTVRTWGIMSSLQGPHYGTYSNTRVWTLEHCYAPALTLAAIFRGLTWRATCKGKRLTCRAFINRLNKGITQEHHELSVKSKVTAGG